MEEPGGDGCCLLCNYYVMVTYCGYLVWYGLLCNCCNFTQNCNVTAATGKTGDSSVMPSPWRKVSTRYKVTKLNICVNIYSAVISLSHVALKVLIIICLFAISVRPWVLNVSVHSLKYNQYCQHRAVESLYVKWSTISRVPVNYEEIILGCGTENFTGLKTGVYERWSISLGVLFLSLVNFLFHFSIPGQWSPYPLKIIISISTQYLPASSLPWVLSMWVLVCLGGPLCVWPVGVSSWVCCWAHPVNSAPCTALPPDMPTLPSSVKKH